MDDSVCEGKGLPVLHLGNALSSNDCVNLLLHVHLNVGEFDEHYEGVSESGAGGLCSCQIGSRLWTPGSHNGTQRRTHPSPG